jgi:hypothetical protein
MKQLRSAMTLAINQTVGGVKTPVMIPITKKANSEKEVILTAFDHIVNSMRDSMSLYYDSRKSLEIKYEIVDLLTNKTVIEIAFKGDSQ